MLLLFMSPKYYRPEPNIKINVIATARLSAVPHMYIYCIMLCAVNSYTVSSDVAVVYM